MYILSPQASFLRKIDKLRKSCVLYLCFKLYHLLWREASRKTLKMELTYKKYLIFFTQYFPNIYEEYCGANEVEKILSRETCVLCNNIDSIYKS